MRTLGITIKYLVTSGAVALTDRKPSQIVSLCIPRSPSHTLHRHRIHIQISHIRHENIVLLWIRQPDCKPVVLLRPARITARSCSPGLRTLQIIAQVGARGVEGMLRNPMKTTRYPSQQRDNGLHATSNPGALSPSTLSSSSESLPAIAFSVSCRVPATSVSVSTNDAERIAASTCLKPSNNRRIAIVAEHLFEHRKAFPPHVHSSLLQFHPLPFQHRLSPFLTVGQDLMRSYVCWFHVLQTLVPAPFHWHAGCGRCYRGSDLPDTFDCSHAVGFPGVPHEERGH